MRSPRLITGTLIAIALLGPAGAASAGEFADLEVSPRSAEPGATVTVNTTACGPGGTADGDATMVGGGRFRLAATTHKEDVVGQFKVGRDTPPGTYPIGATCTNGKFATGDLVVTAGSHDVQGHNQGQGHSQGQGHDQGQGRDQGQAGHDQGQGRDEGGGRLPHGHVETGVGGGTTTETDPAKIAAGAALLAAAAVGGAWVLRRRASGTRT
ncbi:hypothetical protein [Streptomyces sp. NPDC093225]|uniref:hypothetical protein n=1 Tax=Streptomyces sp. NPDC093225 TaxID=3366034 RepID=UPI0038286EF1